MQLWIQGGFAPKGTSKSIVANSKATSRSTTASIHHADHNDAFWNEVDKVLPDYLERKGWLRRHGAGLDV